MLAVLCFAMVGYASASNSSNSTAVSWQNAESVPEYVQGQWEFANENEKALVGIAGVFIVALFLIDCCVLRMCCRDHATAAYDRKMGKIQHEKRKNKHQQNKQAAQHKVKKKKAVEMVAIVDKDTDDGIDLEMSIADLPPPPPLAPATWKKVVDPASQKPYWYNRTTRETTWTKPDGA